MIDIKEKRDCCGCSACVQICPKQCISMSADNEGFLYPQVDTTKCIDCGLCEKVCPVINQNEPREPFAVYAVKNTNDKVRLKSSSGGSFTLLAEQIISEGGVVFGARFNEHWEVVHDYTETMEGLEPFRGSKYVQSIIGDSFFKAKQFLNNGRKVLFSGTPCQIAGLKKYLRKEYSNLLTVDIICHGVPSSLVWEKYKKEIVEHANPNNNPLDLIKLYGINFRDKTKGWRDYHCIYSVVNTNINKVINITNKHIQDPYMRLFIANYSLRPSCYHCPAKSGRSGSDITLGDCWGIKRIEKVFDDNIGVGVCVINEDNYLKDIILLKSKNLLLPYNYLNQHNRSYYNSSIRPARRQEFFEKMESVESVMLLAQEFAPIKGRVLSFAEKAINFISRYLRH